MGPHFPVWSHVTLLLVTYACSLQQRGHLPAVGTCAGRPSSSSAEHAAAAPQAPAAAAVAAGASSSSAQGSMRLRHVSAAWQGLLGQWEHLPATHEQLLGLFGVST